MSKLPLSARRFALLQARARGHRFCPTVSESRLWRELCARRLGVVFRRQVVVGGSYIADFFAPAIRLVVEVDGSLHERTRPADARRDERLRRLGYRVVRVEAVAVMRELAAVVARLRAIIVEELGR